MNKNTYTVLFIFLLFVIFTGPLYADTEDPCAGEGIIVKNMTTIALWRKENGGVCRLWSDYVVFRIKPEDNIEIFSDFYCQNFYCKDNPTYPVYKSLDTNGDCRVRILPGCRLSDM